MTQRMPAVFIGHGSPTNALEDNKYTKAWRDLARALPRPKAILAVSGHFYTRGTAVTAMEKPRALYRLRSAWRKSERRVMGRARWGGDESLLID